MRVLCCKHIGPNIREHRGVPGGRPRPGLHPWSLEPPPPEHHLLFTYLAHPTDSTSRKLMRYLKDNAR
eukprot:9100631-Lingulodinium_polyedra.AAC.1